MICWDIGSVRRTGHASGLSRVSANWLHHLCALRPGKVRPCFWSKGRWQALDDRVRPTPIDPQEGDVVVIPFPFSPLERPGWNDWLAGRRSRVVAVYHDAIPMRWPHITWPRSVSRHPHYLKSLAQLDHVIAVSPESRTELETWWEWVGCDPQPPLTVVEPGADPDGSPRPIPSLPPSGHPSFVCLGILEPRKNQQTLMQAAELLWDRGLVFDLHLCGRVNPHFGVDLVRSVRRLRRHGRTLYHWARAADAQVGLLLEEATATVFPSLAEGYGLPVVESLWRNVPVIASSVPSVTALPDQVVSRIDPLDPPQIAGVLESHLRETPAEALARRHAIARLPLRSWRDSASQLLQSLNTDPT